MALPVLPKSQLRPVVPVSIPGGVGASARFLRRTGIHMPVEYEEAIMLIEWRERVAGIEPRLHSLFHVPNGGTLPSMMMKQGSDGRVKRVSKVWERLRAMGAKRGVVDYLLLAPVQPFHGLVLELKRAGLTPKQAWTACTKEQQQFLEVHAARGYATGVASGWIEAASLLCAYLHRPDLQP